MCQHEIGRDVIKPGTFRCPVCMRGLHWKIIDFPVGTIPVRDEMVVSCTTQAGKPLTPLEMKEMIQVSMRMLAAIEGKIVVSDERDE